MKKLVGGLAGASATLAIGASAPAYAVEGDDLWLRYEATFAPQEQA